jgi:Putative 2OG-Fe(II) oxygenase
VSIAKKNDLMNQEVQSSTLEAYYHFPTAIYAVDKPEFLPSVKSICEQYTEKAMEQNKEINDLYPVIMTDNFFHEESIKEFSKFVGQKAWDILDMQGYSMDNFGTMFYEMWCQTHYKYSLMENHAHSGGSQIIGFYFLEVPENSSRVVFYDPKPAKVQIGFAQKDADIATYASNMINFVPKEGQLMFTNSWLPHSFTKHNNEKPIKFVHFTLGLSQGKVCEISQAEVI